MDENPSAFTMENRVPLTRKLSFRLVRNVILVAIPLGFAFIAVQILLNFAVHKANLDNTAKQVFNIVENAVIHTVWTLDKNGGENFATGVLRHEAIIRVEITDSKGRTFSRAEKDVIGRPSFASQILFGGYRVYTLPLDKTIDEADSIPIGNLILTLDPEAAARAFVKRSSSIVISGVLITVLLAVVLSCVFHVSLVRSLLLAASSLSHILPQSIDGKRIHLPEKHRENELGRFIRNTNDLLEAVEENILSRKTAEEEARRLNRDLEARVRDRTRELEAFTYSVSHDLRTSVRTIEGFSNAMLEDFGDQLDDNGRTYLGFLRDAGMEMNNHIEALLALAKTTAGGITREELDLSSIALQQAEILARSFSGPVPELDIQPGITAVADRRLTTVALKNLLENAFKYTGKSADPKVIFGKTADRGEAVFFVRDNGTGFDMSQADKLFLPFRRIHRDDEFSGTGIGLATVERIILRHHGIIRAESSPGQGAVFYFTLGKG